MNGKFKAGSQLEVIDDTWPCLIVGLPKVVDTQVVEDLRALFEQVFAREQRFVMIADTSRVRGLPSAATRKRMTNWLNEPAFRANIMRLNIGSATVLASAMMRGALMALHWFWRPASPQFHTATRLAGLDWGIAKLEGEGIAIPSALVSYRIALRTAATKG